MTEPPLAAAGGAVVSLGEHWTPHASFGISRDGRLAYAVHVSGMLAHRARLAVAKGDRVTITAGRLRPREDAVAIVDLEAEALTVDLGR